MSFINKIVDNYYDECKDCIWYDYKEDTMRICPERKKKCANYIDKKILPNKAENTPKTPPTSL